MNKKELAKSLAKHFWRKATSKKGYWLTRFVFLRVLGFVYLFAFLSLALQVIPLIGEKGLTPAAQFTDQVSSFYGSPAKAFFKLPSIFFFGVSDTSLLLFSWLGVILSLVILFGYANSIILAVNWFLYMSFDHIGNIWYGYGWEIQLLETGFLAIFLVPLLDARPFPRMAPPAPIIWLLRWLTFRIHIGAGMIKVRGDACWKDLTCLIYHYETQPIPGPLSRLFHFVPVWVHKFGVLFNHFVELIAPFFVFWPRLARHTAGIFLLSLQFILILSGNLSFLNWITIAAIIGCFDDTFWKKILPKRLVKKAEHAEQNCKSLKLSHMVFWVYFIAVIWLSVPVVANLLSSHQAMNTSFNNLHFVNTYGAFGSIGKVRNELVVQGTSDTFINENTQWKEYEFPGKPTRLDRRLPWIAPYQPRIDWQIWFAAMSNYQRDQWVTHMVWKLMHNDEQLLKLVKENPFPDEPPNYIRIEFYRYRFATLGSGSVWEREHIGTWLPPLSKETPELRQFIENSGWEMYGGLRTSTSKDESDKLL